MHISSVIDESAPPYVDNSDAARAKSVGGYKRGGLTYSTCSFFINGIGKNRIFPKSRHKETLLFKLLKELDSKSYIYILLCIIWSGAIFLYMYGVDVILFQNDDWILNKGLDLGQHYMGWKFFRNSDWYFPIGMMNTCVYPDKVSVIYTDSIPLLAVIFKAFRSVLPATFQYFGLFGLIGFNLNSIISASILKKYIKSNIKVTFISTFFILSTPMMAKMFFHSALASGQWLILLAILIWIRGDELKSKLTEHFIWGAMGALAASIHLYFVPMIGMILLGKVLWDVFGKGKKESLAYILEYCGMVIVTFAFWGGFNGLQSDVDISELSRFNANLNAFVNSSGTSRFIKYMPHARDGQGEGFAYLGLGGIMAACFSLIILLNREKSEKVFVKDGKFIWCILIIVISMIISLGTAITFNEIEFIKLPYPDILSNIWKNFRATGRFIWVAYYLILAGSIIILIKRKKELLIILFCFLQIVDFSSYMAGKHKEYSEINVYDYIIKSDEWDKITEGITEIVLLPNWYNYVRTLYDIADFATDRQIYLNDFYLGHGAIEDLTGNYKEYIESGDIAGKLFFIEEEEIQYFSKYMKVYNVDGFYVAVKEASE